MRGILWESEGRPELEGGVCGGGGGGYTIDIGAQRATILILFWRETTFSPANGLGNVSVIPKSEKIF